MRLRGLGTALALASIVNMASPAGAGPWVPGAGHGYAKAWVKWLPGFGYRDGSGKTFAYGAYHEVFLSTYGEAGVGHNLAVTAHLPLVRFFSLADPLTDRSTFHWTPGDPTFGLRWLLLARGRFALALEGAVTIPIAPDEARQTVFATEDGNPAIGELRIGAGVVDGRGGLSMGLAWPRFYLAAGVHLVVRAGGFDDVLTWSLEGGGRVSERWSLRLRITGWHPLANGDAPRAESPSGIGNGTAYTGVALEADYRLSKTWAIGGSLEGALGYYRRQSGGPVLAFFGAANF